MKRRWKILLLLLCAGALGWGAGEVLYRQSWSRSLVGEALGRGRFLALVRGHAIHERDLFKDGDGRAETMLAAEVLRRSLPDARIPTDAAEKQMDLVRAQFGDERNFAAALASAHLSEAWLRTMVADQLAVQQWIESRIAPELKVTDEECRRLYENERALFELPVRYRASHLFLATPEGTNEEVVQAKRSLAEGLSVRLLAGESLADLAAEASEDEATKDEGGDLGYFSDVRMPPDFLSEIRKLSVGQTSAPVRCHLGFHLIALTEIVPARQSAFDEVRSEIAVRIMNQKRARAVATLTSLIRQPEWSRVARTRR